MIKSKFVLILLFTVLVLASCTTTVRLQVQRMPTLDTSGIQRLAVMPFEAAGRPGGASIYQTAALHATNTATRRVQETGRFTLVSPEVIRQIGIRNPDIEGYVDALFMGQITNIGLSDSTTQEQRVNRETGETETFIIYIREVSVDFNYHLIRTRDGSMIGPIFRRGSSRSISENQWELDSESLMVQNAISDQMRTLNRDIAPFNITVTRRLENERENRDRALRDKMRAAETQVRARNYRGALEAYLAIYELYRSVAAAVNASIVHEVLGQTQAAADFMLRVVHETGSTLANNTLARLNRELREQAAVSGYADTRRMVDRASDHAISEINRVLPTGARVWVYNSSAGNNLTDAVVDNLTAGFIRRGVGIVDRQNIALIEAEQIFQASGTVSDADFVSIGNLAGASAIVIIGITGTGDMRRLQVRVLDIERGQPILQSDTSEVWRL